MENQHRLISGYRELEQAEIDLMNEVKDHGKDLEALMSKIEQHSEPDKRWLSIARTDLQKGIMALTRSVAKPDSF